MKNIFILLIILVPFCVFGQAQISVDFNVTNDATDSKLIEVSYCATGGEFVGDGADDWAGQVITIGFEASSGVSSSAPNVNPDFTEFSSGVIPFVNAFNAASPITFTPGGIGGADDGNVYVSFVTTSNTSDVQFQNGECKLVFSFKVPDSYGTASITEMFLNEDELSGGVETQPTITNAGDNENKWDGSSQSSALPIELYGFTATKDIIRNNVNLEWSTASEINGSHFEVQRSRNLENWITIGTVQAIGESTTLQEYSHVDSDLLLNTRGASKNFYYRLNMIDKDASQEYSDIRSVRFDQDGEGDFIVYPNPTNNEVFVNLSSITEETGPATMNVMNLQGQLVKKVTLATSDDIKVDVSDIQAGAYFFIVRQGEKTFAQKVLKIN